MNETLVIGLDINTRGVSHNFTFGANLERRAVTESWNFFSAFPVKKLSYNWSNNKIRKINLSFSMKQRKIHHIY